MVKLRHTAAFALALASLWVATDVDARSMINVDYIIAVPHGEVRTYTANASPQGLGLEARYQGKRFKGGIGISWQVFREERQAPGTPSGAEYEARTTSLVPLLASGYYVSRQGSLYAFVGVGVGAMLARRTLDAQAEETTDSTWYASASGACGVIVEVTRGLGVEGKLRYVGGFKNGSKPIGMMQFALGLTFFY